MSILRPLRFPHHQTRGRHGNPTLIHSNRTYVEVNLRHNPCTLPTCPSNMPAGGQSGCIPLALPGYRKAILEPCNQAEIRKTNKNTQRSSVYKCTQLAISWGILLFSIREITNWFIYNSAGFGRKMLTVLQGRLWKRSRVSQYTATLVHGACNSGQGRLAPAPRPPSSILQSSRLLSSFSYCSPRNTGCLIHRQPSYWLKQPNSRRKFRKRKFSSFFNWFYDWPRMWPGTSHSTSPCPFP